MKNLMYEQTYIYESFQSTANGQFRTELPYSHTADDGSKKRGNTHC